MFDFQEPKNSNASWPNPPWEDRDHWVVFVEAKKSPEYHAGYRFGMILGGSLLLILYVISKLMGN